jgi:ribosome-associated protein
MVFTVPPGELKIRASRAGGPGGQHVNTSATRVEVRWNVATSASLTDSERAMLLEKLKSRIDTRGVLRVVADQRRSQQRNRDAAIERLNSLVRGALKRRRPRKKTKPSRAAVERRLAEKRRRADTKQHRRPVGPDE